MGDLLTVGSVQKELKEAQHLVESFLQSRLNVEVEQKSFDEFQDAFRMWTSSIKLSGAPSYCQLLALPSGMKRYYIKDPA